MKYESKEEMLSYGCIFCLTGKESQVAKDIQNNYQGIRVRSVCQTKRYTCRGETELKDDIVLKGYIFIEVTGDFNISKLKANNEFITVLTYTDGDWRLTGDDEEYAKWIFKYDGLLSLSKAYKVGDQIQIISGPLKDFEGQITRIDKRNRSGQISVMFAGREHKIWLGFDIVKEYPANEVFQLAGEK